MCSRQTGRAWGWFVVMIIVAVGAQYACDDGPTKSKRDRIAPLAITDLSVEVVSPTAVRLTWTATGDDSTAGRAAEYDIRCSGEPIVDSASWEGATSCASEPLPLPAGEAEEFLYTSLNPASRYFFALRAADDAGNWSELSNLDSVRLMPLFAEPLRTVTSAYCERFEVADLDGDGDSDVVKYDFWNGLGILLNDGSGNLMLQPEFNFQRRMGSGDIGDLDGDHDKDVATISYNLDSVFVFRQTSPGSLELDTSWYVNDGPYGVAIADFNNDGDNDLAVILESDLLQIYSNDGHGNFVLTDSCLTGMAPYKVIAQDLDRDGDLDLAVPNYYGYSVSVYLNDGFGDFTERQRASAGQCPDGIVVADFTGDSIPDIAVTNRFVQTVTALRGNGDGTFTGYDTVDATGMCRVVAAGDLDGDGDRDLALANETVYGATVLFNSGGLAGFSGSLQLEDENWCFDVAIVDMDGDSDFDVVTGHNAISVFLNNSVNADEMFRRIVAQR